MELRVEIATLSIMVLIVFYAALAQYGKRALPLSELFYRIGWNTLDSFKANYGLNYILAGAGTFIMVKTGIDWNWNIFAYSRRGLAVGAGFSLLIIGILVPVGASLGCFLYGRRKGDMKLKYAGLAMGQAALIGMLMTSAMKAFTGRPSPGLIGDKRYDGDFSGEFAFGFMERGISRGWPSGHTATAFAMAAALAQMYPKNRLLKIAAYLYAVIMGAGMSISAHWASDCVAGALIGCAIGKSVGASYRRMAFKALAK
jgi:membrane-associated phospholipid phosphatase